jgi:hypothetical protein
MSGVRFIECEAGKWVNLAHVAVIAELEYPAKDGSPRFELLSADKSRLGIAQASSFDHLIESVITVPEPAP